MEHSTFVGEAQKDSVGHKVGLSKWHACSDFYDFLSSGTLTLEGKLARKTLRIEVSLVLHPASATWLTQPK